MTGYSTHKLENKDVRIEFNIKAVNGRFLETRFHIPKELIIIEPELRKIINAVIQRGTLDIFCHRKVKKASSSSRVEVDQDLAQKIGGEINKLQKQLKLNTQVSLSDLLTIAPIIKIHEEQELSKNESQLVIKAFKECVEKCQAEREREGHSIKKELLNLINHLSIQVASIKKQRAVNTVEYIEKWKEKIKSKGHNEMLDDQKMQQEICFMAEKADIAEEIQRLEEHLKNYKNLLLSKKSEGKKIDFYTQELLREINTIGSKSQSAKITQHVVEAKGLIEKLREQAQNIE